MLKYVNYDIVFQEVPNEVSLAINISNCPNNCKGCHSPHLKQNIGQELDKETIRTLLDKYQNAITCICFMGGDADPYTITELAAFIKKETNNKVKTAWYSGKNSVPPCALSYLDYLKTGPYIEEKGGLDSPYTNQRFYKNEYGKMIDNTNIFTKKRLSVNT